MTTYKYSAISRGGQRVNGVVEAFDQMDAVDRIKQECDIVLKISEVKEGGLLSRDLDTKLNAKAFTMMCSQFAIILGAGIPVGRTVHLIADKTTDKMLKKILRQVADDVEGGRSLAASFEDRGGKLMPTTFVETLRAGEASGTMDRSFRSMYEHFDKQTKM
nr:type II secretion system F family protein [Oscillospiraceae bacterium]